MRLGMNLSSVNYGESDVKCGDAAIHGTGWNGAPAGYKHGSRFLPTAGYMLPDLQGYRRPGTYTLRCAGNGVLQYADTTYGYPWLRFGEQPDKTFRNAYPLELKGGTGLGAIVTVESNPYGDKLALRDLELLTPGAVDGQLWHPQYLSAIEPFNGGYRFYDWSGGTLDTGPGCTWEARDQRPGMGIQGAVDLCNRTGRDMWLTLPVHCVTAQGVTDLPAGLGAYLAKALDPARTVYLELGDELWNGGGGYVWQYYYLQTIGKSLLNPATGEPMNSLWLTAAYTLHTAAQAIRAALPAAGPKLKVVLAGQCTWYGNSAFYLVTWFGREGWPWDVLSCGPYAFWPETGPYTSAAVTALIGAGNLDGAIELIAQGLEYSTTTVLLPSLAEWQGVAKAAGVPMAYYEMGLDYSGLWSHPNTAPAAQAFRNSPRAADCCAWFLGQVAPFAELGMWFQDSSADCWGARTHADDADSKIWPALLAYAAGRGAA